jgi:hypothetical protein
MKIFNKENGKEKVYVQMQDIMTVVHEDINCGIPASIFEKVFGDVLIVDDSNRWEFLEFDKPEEVEFFRGLDWIPDYKEFRNKSREEMVAISEELNETFNADANKWNNMTSEERKANEDIYTRCTLLQHKINTLPRIFFTCQGHYTLGVPDVIDSDGYDCGSNEEYEAISALEPNKVIIRRKDGQALNKGNIKKSFIKAVIANSIVNLEDVRAGLCTAGRAKYSISEDGMYVVITIGVNPVLTEEEIQNKKENSFARRLLRRITGTETNI